MLEDGIKSGCFQNKMLAFACINSNLFQDTKNKIGYTKIFKPSIISNIHENYLMINYIGLYNNTTLMYPLLLAIEGVV